MSRPLALVTGACSGIGLSLARQLALRGHDLYLVSNRAGPLEEAARALAAAHGVEAATLALDLATPDAAERVHAAVSAGGRPVDVLVNNAGMLLFGEAVDADPARANALLQLHVVTPSLLATRFGREMRARRRGHLLIVSSISAWRAMPGITYYGSSKVYLRNFAWSLRSELAPYGVKVTCLAPGATATGLYDPKVVPVELGKRLGIMMDPERVAAAGVEALFRGDALCMPGLLTRAMTWASVAMPQALIDLLRRRGPWLRSDG